MAREIDTDSVIAGVRAFVDELESGYRPIPMPGVGLRQVAGCTVVPVVIHDALCGWRVFSRQDEDDPALDVAACAGCGLAMQISDLEGRR